MQKNSSPYHFLPKKSKCVESTPPPWVVESSESGIRNNLPKVTQPFQMNLILYKVIFSISLVKIKGGIRCPSQWLGGYFPFMFVFRFPRTSSSTLCVALLHFLALLHLERMSGIVFAVKRTQIWPKKKKNVCFPKCTLGPLRSATHSFEEGHRVLWGVPPCPLRSSTKFF